MSGNVLRQTVLRIAVLIMIYAIGHMGAICIHGLVLLIQLVTNATRWQLDASSNALPLGRPISRIDIAQYAVSAGLSGRY